MHAKIVTACTNILSGLYIALKFVWLCRGADKCLAFPISPIGGLQHNQKNFSWMG
jgi:hypothetical protein